MWREKWPFRGRFHGLSRPPTNGLTKPKTADGETRTRTGDTTIFSRVLYQLSYLAESPAKQPLFVAWTGVAMLS